MMEIIDNIIPLDDRKRKYTDRQILKILIPLQIFGILYKSLRILLPNHEEYLTMRGIYGIPSFQILSRSCKFHMQAFNRNEENGL